jgi:hypothetical protein
MAVGGFPASVNRWQYVHSDVERHQHKDRNAVEATAPYRASGRTQLGGSQTSYGRDCVVNDSASSGRHSMFIVRSMAVVQNRVLCREIPGFWAQPGVDILRLDGDDAAVMTRSGNLRWRLIGDGG